MLSQLFNSELEVEASDENLAPRILESDFDIFLLTSSTFGCFGLSDCIRIRLGNGRDSKSSRPKGSTLTEGAKPHHSWIRLRKTWNWPGDASLYFSLIIICRLDINPLVQYEVAQIVLTDDPVLHLLGLLLVLENHLDKTEASAPLSQFVSHDNHISNLSKLREVFVQMSLCII